MHTIRHQTARRAALAVVMAMVLAVPLAVQVVGTPAAAATDLRLETNDTEPYSSLRLRTVSAQCDSNEVVIGGGATIVDGASQVRLTKMYPHLSERGYSAEAEEPDTGYADEWQLRVYAVCARRSSVPGYELPPLERTGESSSVFKTETAGCPGNKKVIGTGALIGSANGQVGLTMMRPAGPLDIARASAREDADGYAQDWELLVQAICADRIESAAVYGTVKYQNYAAFNCPPDKFVHSVGGGGGLTDSGPYFIKSLSMGASLKGGSIVMTGPPIGGIGAGATCAYV